MNLPIKIKLCIFFILSLLPIGYAFSSSSNNLFSVELNDGKTRVQYRLKAENSGDFISFHHLLLKAGYERNTNQDLGVATKFELADLKLETFLYKTKNHQDGDLVVSISISGVGNNYFGHKILSMEGNSAYPLFELVKTFGEKVDVRSGVVAYNFEQLRCNFMSSEHVTKQDVNCVMIQ